MKREGGLWATAAVLGIAATIGISSNQTKPPTGTSGQPQAVKSSSPSPAEASNPIENGPCPDIEKLLQTFFLVPKDQVVAPRSCYPTENQPANSTVLQEKAARLQIVIATLPDPLHTHFSLAFDRATEAIQEAAQDEQYIYNSSWLPWDTEQPSYALLNDQDEVDKRIRRAGSADDGRDEELQREPVAADQIRVPGPPTDRAFVHEFLGRQELRCSN